MKKNLAKEMKRLCVQKYRRGPPFRPRKRKNEKEAKKTAHNKVVVDVIFLYSKLIFFFFSAQGLAFLHSNADY
jgi:hypothetical protein